MRSLCIAGLTSATGMHLHLQLQLKQPSFNIRQRVAFNVRVGRISRLSRRRHQRIPVAQASTGRARPDHDASQRQRHCTRCWPVLDTHMKQKFKKRKGVVIVVAILDGCVCKTVDVANLHTPLILDSIAGDTTLVLQADGALHVSPTTTRYTLAAGKKSRGLGSTR